MAVGDLGDLGQNLRRRRRSRGVADVSVKFPDLEMLDVFTLPAPSVYSPLVRAYGVPPTPE